MTEGNGALKTPGGWSIKGGSLMILAAAFAGVVYLGWLDRQETLKANAATVMELRYIRCALRIQMLEPVARLAVSAHLESGQDWDRACKWLEFGRGMPPGEP